MTALEVARGKLGMRETGGHNRSPFIDMLNRWVGAPQGSPYCASGVSWCFHQAAGENAKTLLQAGQLFKTAGSLAVRQWFERKKLLSWDPQKLLNWKGALFGWTNADGHGHVGFVARRLTVWKGNQATITGIETLEFNTNRAGSRDGDGVWGRKRTVPIDGEHKLWFCDTSSLAGGAWW